MRTRLRPRLGGGTEASEFAVAADRHGVVSVPAIVANDRLAWVGNVPEPRFVANLLQARRRRSDSL